MIDWPVLQIEPIINCAGIMAMSRQTDSEKKEIERKRKEIGCRTMRNTWMDFVLVSVLFVFLYLHTRCNFVDIVDDDDDDNRRKSFLPSLIEFATQSQLRNQKAI